MEETKQKIRVFSTPTCPYCVTLKEFLKEKGFEFADIDVSQDQPALEEMVAKTKQMGVPVIDIDGTFIVGFDRDKIIKLLNIQE